MYHLARLIKKIPAAAMKAAIVTRYTQSGNGAAFCKLPSVLGGENIGLLSA
jgi:hypothetical protein